jgi:hypothetical protein
MKSTHKLKSSESHELMKFVHESTSEDESDEVQLTKVTKDCDGSTERQHRR